MDAHTILLIIKIALAIIAASLAIMKGKTDKHIMTYWILVCLYWSLNAITEFIK